MRQGAKDSGKVVACTAPPFVQAVHGDSHFDNAIQTAVGPLRNDWNDACLAPRALDLACMGGGGLGLRRRARACRRAV